MTKEFPVLTTWQSDLIAGSLLGDGCLHSGPSGNARFLKNQAIVKREYLQWMYEQLLPYSSNIFDKETSGISFVSGKIVSDVTKPKLQSCWMYTSRHPYFTALKSIWYKNGVKVIPSGFVLTPPIIAIWFFDDGHIDVSRHRAGFCTNGFTLDECRYLSDQLRLFDIEAKVSVEKTATVIISLD
jgi:hypothetical protein